MEFFCKKTFELTTTELEQIADLFNRVFENDASPDVLLSHYKGNPIGYSFHSMMKDEGRIVGFSAYVPAYYIYEGKRYVFAYSGGYMTDKAYRDFFNFRDIVKNAQAFMKKEGVVLNFGYPNDNAYPVMIKGKLSRYVGKMHTYCLPYRIGGIKARLSWLNWLSKLCSKLFVTISALFASCKEYKFVIHKEDKSFNEYRYKQNGGEYCCSKLKHGEFYYKITEHEGVRTAFILDVLPKSSKNFVDSVRYLLKHHSKEFDLVLYPGELPFEITGMVKLPRKVEPKNFNMTANILDKNAVDEKVIYDIKNWDTNLSNYDLI